MSILTDNLWPKDIPESGRLIALLGMVQIMEDDVDTPDKLVQALRQYQHNDCSGLLAGFDYDETIAVVSKLDAEIERLNGLVAMHAEAFNDFKRECHYDDCCVIPKAILDKMDDCFEASSDTVSAYKREVQAEALENAAGWPWTGIIFLDDRSFVKEELNHAASELRAKGE